MFTLTIGKDSKGHLYKDTNPTISPVVGDKYIDTFGNELVIVRSETFRFQSELVASILKTAPILKKHNHAIDPNFLTRTERKKAAKALAKKVK